MGVELNASSPLEHKIEGLEGLVNAPYSFYEQHLEEFIQDFRKDTGVGDDFFTKIRTDPKARKRFLDEYRTMCKETLADLRSQQGKTHPGTCTSTSGKGKTKSKRSNDKPTKSGFPA